MRCEILQVEAALRLMIMKTYDHEALSSLGQYNIIEKIQDLEPARLDFDLSQYMTYMD